MHFNHILVTTDFSDASKVAFDIAAYQSKMEGTKVTLLTVARDWIVPPEMMSQVAMPERIEEYRKNIRKQAEDQLRPLTSRFHGQKVELKIIVSMNEPADDICEFAKSAGCDLIVMSTQGHGSLGALIMGSTSQKVVRHAPCPVLLVPAHI